MRIGLDILSEVAGRSSGTETYLQGFFQALQRINEGRHQFFLFVNAGNREFYTIPDRYFTQVRFPFSSRRQFLRVLSQLSLIPFQARRLSLDVVNFLGTTGAFALGCATVQHIKTLHHLQHPETVARSSGLFRRLLMGTSARKADAVIANTEHTRQAIIQHLGVDASRVVVIPEAVDHRLFFPETPESPCQGTLEKYGVTRPYILFVSSLWPYKNVHGLIKVYSELLQNFETPHSLVIVGGLTSRNYQDLLHRQVKEARLDHRVQFVGHVINRREIRDFYVGADVFVYPSFAETFGLTLLESMACGTPVVASNRTSIPEVAGNAAVLVDPDDLQGFTRALGEVLTDVTLRTSLIKRGLQRAQEFTWDRTAAETLKAYQLALDLRNGNART